MGHSQPHTSHSAAEPSLRASIQDMLRSGGMLLLWRQFWHYPVHLLSSERGGKGPDRNRTCRSRKGWDEWDGVTLLPNSPQTLGRSSVETCGCSVSSSLAVVQFPEEGGRDSRKGQDRDLTVQSLTGCPWKTQVLVYKQVF